MKKALSTILALVLILSLCGGAFAANDQLYVTSETVREGNTTATRYWFRNAAGTLIHAKDFYFNLNGAVIREDTFNYDQSGRLIYQRRTGMDANTWKDEEVRRVYQSDGSSIEDTRVYWKNPGGKDEFAYIHSTEDANGNGTETHEQRNADGSPLYVAVTEYGVNENGDKFERVNTSYPDGSKELVVTRTPKDGKTIIMSDKTDASGKKTMDLFWQIDPDGSFVRDEVVYDTLADGREVAVSSKEYTDDAGAPRVEEYRMVYDEDGYGRGKGILRNGYGEKLADLIVQNYDEEDENGDTVSREIITYLYPDGKIDLRYVTSDKDGETTERMDRDVKDYDGGDDEAVEEIDWDSDDWDFASDSWTPFLYEDTDFVDPIDPDSGDGMGDADFSEFENWDYGGWDDSGWDDGSWDDGGWDNSSWDDGGWDNSGWDDGGWDDGGWDDDSSD